MFNELLLDNQKVVDGACDFLRREFQKANRTRAVVGVSGGVDSAVVAVLCQRAGLDLQAVFMPYRKLSKCPKGNFIEKDITQIVDLLAGPKADKVSKGNIMARIRMIILYDLAGRLNGLVVGTENLSEYHLGYFTLHGDQACDLNPIGRLFKTQVVELAKYLGVSIRTPSAELYSGQTDEKELGFSYQEADPILRLHCLCRLSPERIIKEFGFEADLVNKVIEKVKTTDYKRQGVPRYEPY